MPQAGGEDGLDILRLLIEDFLAVVLEQGPAVIRTIQNVIDEIPCCRITRRDGTELIRAME